MHRARGRVLAGSFPRRVATTGTVAGATSVLALALVALGEHKGAAQPLNATSHWLNGERAARRRALDLRHTGVGLATHLAATLFWTGFFEAWVAVRPVRGGGDLVLRATTVSAAAAFVDYAMTPRRFTPGWEFVLTRRAMAVVYAAMAAGFAAAPRG